MSVALHIRGFGNAGFRGSSGATNHTVDASNEGIAWAFQPHTADPITHIGYRYGARTGIPPVFVGLIEGLDSSGLPDGTDVGGGSPTAATFTPPADTTIDGLWRWLALTNAYTPTRGQMLAAVIRYSSGTIDGSNNSSFTRTVTNISHGGSIYLPYAITNTGGTWTKVTNVAPTFGYRTANGRYGWVWQSNYATNTANTAGHRSGMFFTIPSGHGTSYKIVGASMSGDFGTNSGFKLGIWSTDGTQRQLFTGASGQLAASPSAGDTINPIYFPDTTLYDFQYGTKYYIAMEVVSGAVGLNGITLAEAADRSAFPNGTNRGLVTFDGSTWTETDTVMPLCELILEDVTVPSGGSSGGFIIGG